MPFFDFDFLEELRVVSRKSAVEICLSLDYFQNGGVFNFFEEVMENFEKYK